MTCKHLMKSDEAYSMDSRGDLEPITVLLCDWPDQNPDRFLNAPRWLLKKIGPGLAVEPERDCVGCPAYSEA